MVYYLVKFKKTNMGNQILRPDIFLSELIRKSKEATEKTRKLYLKSYKIVNETKTDEGVILFRNETLKVKAERHLNVIPKPHYFIRGIEFITGINHNNYFDDNSEFWVNVLVKLLISYDDTKPNYYNISAEEHNNLFYGCRIDRLIFEEKEYQGEKYGVIERPHDGSWDAILEIDNFEDFKKLRGIFMYGCNKIGLHDLASPSTNKNLKELSLI